MDGDVLRAITFGAVALLAAVWGVVAGRRRRRRELDADVRARAARTAAAERSRLDLLRQFEAREARARGHRPPTTGGEAA